MMRLFAVSDVHDHYDLLVKVLDDNDFDRNNPDHRLVLCGDAFYNGPQPGELFVFLRNLWKDRRLIFIRGNHDYELLDYLKTGRPGRPGNRRCAELLVRHLTGRTDLTDPELQDACAELGFTDFLETAPVWYYETGNFVFTHGFIPTLKNAYNPDWRNASEREWRHAASRGDAMLLCMRYGIREPGKTIVCGHYSAARCYLMRHATESAWTQKLYKDVSAVAPHGFRTFYGDGFIALDASTKKTGFVNCIVMDVDDT